MILIYLRNTFDHWRQYMPYNNYITIFCWFQGIIDVGPTVVLYLLLYYVNTVLICLLC